MTLKSLAAVVESHLLSKSGAGFITSKYLVLVSANRFVISP